MAASLRKQLAAAQARREAAMDAVFSAAPTPHVPFSECRALASPDVCARYDAACAKVDEIEREGIDKGRAWRGANGFVRWR